MQWKRHRPHGDFPVLAATYRLQSRQAIRQDIQPAAVQLQLTSLNHAWLCVLMHPVSSARRQQVRVASDPPPPPLTTADKSFGWLRNADAANSTDHHTEEAYSKYQYSCTVPVGFCSVLM